MFGVVLVLLHIAAVLPLEIHFVLFYIGGKHVVRAHAEHLRHADEKMKQVNDFNTRILLVKFLILRPPFPWDAIGEFGHFLRHRAAVI